jgi:hypothetical protein
MIPMIEAALRTAPMAPARGADRGAARSDTPPSNRRGRGHTTCRSQRGRYSVGRFSGEAACPRRRSGIAFRLDTARKPWHKRDDWLGLSEHRGGHRGLGGFSSRPSPHLPQRAAYATRVRSLNPKRPWTLPPLWTHRTRPQGFANLAQNARFAQRPQPFSFFQKNDDEEQLQRRWSRFTRFQVSADSGP